VIAAPFAPEAIVFDLDGVLVDSEPLWAEAEREVVMSFGRPWAPDVQRLLLGKGPEAAVRTLAAHLGEDDHEEVGRRLASAAVDAFHRGVDPRPGVPPLIEALHRRVPLGVATNSVRLLAEIALESAGLDGLIEAVVTAEDVLQPKPAPDPYARACARLGADPSRSIAIEDSPVGAASALAAGLWVVACPSMPGTVIPGAHAVVGSLSEIDADALLGTRHLSGG
jgi:HAD superfamily hydrolase (TIGR01509 family)